MSYQKEKKKKNPCLLTLQGVVEHSGPSCAWLCASVSSKTPVSSLLTHLWHPCTFSHNNRITINEHDWLFLAVLGAIIGAITDNIFFARFRQTTIAVSGLVAVFLRPKTESTPQRMIDSISTASATLWEHPCYKAVSEAECPWHSLPQSIGSSNGCAFCVESSRMFRDLFANCWM